MPMPKKERHQIPCACGCGTIITTPNKQCKEVRFCHGHANRVLKKGKLQPHLQKCNEERRTRHIIQDRVEGKICSACKLWKPLSEYAKHAITFDRLETRCKPCERKRSLDYYKRHRERINQRRKTEEFKQWFRPYQAKWIRERYRIDLAYRLKRQLRCALYDALKGRKKSKHLMELLGCTIEELITYLERQFQPGMTWENYGQPGWEVDHIRPCASFDLNDPEQLAVCFHYTNLQPLWGTDNAHKRTKYPYLPFSSTKR